MVLLVRKVTEGLQGRLAGSLLLGGPEQRLLVSGVVNATQEFLHLDRVDRLRTWHLTLLSLSPPLPARVVVAQLLVLVWLRA